MKETYVYSRLLTESNGYSFDTAKRHIALNSGVNLVVSGVSRPKSIQFCKHQCDLRKNNSQFFTETAGADICH